MFVKADRQLVKVNYSEILFFEAQKEYINIHTLKEKYLFYKRMKDLEEQLPDNFIRIHHSFIINLDCINKIDVNSVIINNEEIPIGASYKEAFQEIIKPRMF